MQQDFLNGLFEVLVIPESKQKELRKNLQEILTYNFAISLLEELHERKRDSFVKLLKENQVNKKVVQAWAKENKIAEDKKFLKKLDQSAKQSFRDYFAVLVKDLEEPKRQEVIKYAKGYLK